MEHQRGEEATWGARPYIRGVGLRGRVTSCSQAGGIGLTRLKWALKAFLDILIWKQWGAAEGFKAWSLVPYF